YLELSKPPKLGPIALRAQITGTIKADNESPFKPIEKQLGISIENDLLPLLGGEIAIGLPMKGLNVFGITGPTPPAPDKKDKENEPDQPASSNAPIVAVSVKDRERLRELMPKLIEGLGFKGASQFATTERREDTEIVSYANLFAYAFVGNFLVLSSDAAATR